MSGADWEHTLSGGLVRPCGACRFFAHVMHSVLGGSEGMLPQENFYHMRVLLRLSETTITT